MTSTWRLPAFAWVGLTSFLFGLSTGASTAIGAVTAHAVAKIGDNCQGLIDERRASGDDRYGLASAGAQVGNQFGDPAWARAAAVGFIDANGTKQDAVSESGGALPGTCNPWYDPNAWVEGTTVYVVGPPNSSIGLNVFVPQGVEAADPPTAPPYFDFVSRGPEWEEGNGIPDGMAPRDNQLFADRPPEEVPDLFDVDLEVTASVKIGDFEALAPTTGTAQLRYNSVPSDALETTGFFDDAFAVGTFNDSRTIARIIDGGAFITPEPVVITTGENGTSPLLTIETFARLSGGPAEVPQVDYDLGELPRGMGGAIEVVAQLEEDPRFVFSFCPDSALQPGDADQDLDFDQLDLVRAQQAGKYLTGEGATWGEGDWDGAPGGAPGIPPQGDGRFDQLDIVTVLNSGIYLSGSYAPGRAGRVCTRGYEDDQMASLVYDANTGQLKIDAAEDEEINSLTLESHAGIITGQVLGDFAVVEASIFKVTFRGQLSGVSLGNIMEPGLTEAFLLDDLTVAGTRADGSDLGNLDLIHIPVPEPASILLSALALLGLLALVIRTKPRLKARGE
jgi:hypothetical protein